MNKIVIYINEDDAVVSVALNGVFVSPADWDAVYEGGKEYSDAQASPFWPGPAS